MTREDLRKMIGAYATGTLTDAEKKELFEAALDDQEIFDELVHEQSLKEIFQQPGAKSRLIAALDDPAAPLAWWRKPLVWWLAGAVAVAVFAATWIVERPQPSQQIAAVESKPVPPAPYIEPAPAAVRDAKQSTAPPRLDDTSRKPSENPGHKDGDQPSFNEPTRTEKAKPNTPVEADALKKADVPKNEIAASPPPQEQRNQVAGALAAPRAALRGAPIAPLSFDYTLGDGVLILNFPVEGYFSIHFSPGLDTIVDSHVTPGTTRRESIPNNATEANIVFTPAPQTTSGGVTVVREDRRGAVSDPSRTRIELLLRFYP